MLCKQRCTFKNFFKNEVESCSDDELAMLHRQCEKFLKLENRRISMIYLKNFQAHFGLHYLFCISQKQELL